MNSVRAYAGKRLAVNRQSENQEGVGTPATPDEWLERNRSRCQGFVWPGRSLEVTERKSERAALRVGQRHYDWPQAPAEFQVAVCEFAISAGLGKKLASVPFICAQLTLLGRDQKVVKGEKGDIRFEEATPVPATVFFTVKMSGVSVRLSVDNLRQALMPKLKS